MTRIGKNNPLIIKTVRCNFPNLAKPLEHDRRKVPFLIKTLTDEEVSAASLAAYLAISLCSSSRRLALSSTLLRVGEEGGKTC